MTGDDEPLNDCGMPTIPAEGMAIINGSYLFEAGLMPREKVHGLQLMSWSLLPLGHSIRQRPCLHFGSMRQAIREGGVKGTRELPGLLVLGRGRLSPSNFGSPLIVDGPAVRFFVHADGEGSRHNGRRMSRRHVLHEGSKIKKYLMRDMKSNMGSMGSSMEGIRLNHGIFEKIHHFCGVYRMAPE